MHARKEILRAGLTWRGAKIGSRKMKVAPYRSITFFIAVLTWAVAGVLRADVIETKDGTHLVGHITKIADGKVYIDTEFAGPIAVIQTHIVRLETDGPVAVRLLNGQRYDGRLSGTNGTEQVVLAAGPVTANIPEIAASWEAGAPDPALVKPHYHWKLEAGVDVTGKSGTHNQLGTAYGVTATLARLKDTLVLTTNYNRQITDGLKSADQFKAGADYTDNYSDRNSWYARDEGGFDRIKDLSEYDTAAVGLGYDFVKRIRQTLTARVGVAYRYEDYSSPDTPNIHSSALDLGLNHTVRFDNSLLTTRLAIVPAFNDFANVRITHETDYDIPLANSAWKVRLGFSNDYSSKPGDDVKKFDTTYFGRLIVSWK